MKKYFMFILFAMCATNMCGENTPSHDEIWYTSSDGKIVKPYKTENFGAKLLSNTYADGKGVIKFDGNVTKIGDWSFYDCSKLTSMTIPNTVTSIGTCAFSKCNQLTAFDIPDSVTILCNQAFKETGLRSITIPGNVKTIEQWVFSYCSNLTDVTIESGITSIGERVFEPGDAILSITVPNTVTDIGINAFGDVNNIVYDGSLTDDRNWGAKCRNGYIEDSLVYSSSSKEFLCGCPSNKVGAIVLPNNTKVVCNSAFTQCKSITSVVMFGVDSLGFWAFDDCTKLRAVTLGPNIRYIGSAFWGCNSIQTLICHATNPPELQSSEFEYANVYIPCGLTQSYLHSNYWMGVKNYVEMCEGESAFVGTSALVDEVDATFNVVANVPQNVMSFSFSLFPNVLRKNEICHLTFDAEGSVQKVSVSRLSGRKNETSLKNFQFEVSGLEANTDYFYILSAYLDSHEAYSRTGTFTTGTTSRNQAIVKKMLRDGKLIITNGEQEYTPQGVSLP